MSDYRIIDADGHVMELDSELREFIGAPYKDLEWHQSYSFWPGLTMDGFLRSLRKPGGWAGGGTGPNAQDWLRFLDINKIELTVLYPTQGLTHGAIQDHDWAVCMARAYNDWLYNKFMAVSPRLVGVALLPIQDIGEAVKELRRAVNELGMVGAVLPAVAPGGRLYSGAEFYPLWEEAQKLDVPISTHGGLSMPALGLDSVNNFTIGHTLEHPFAQIRQFTALMFEGRLRAVSRFPFRLHRVWRRLGAVHDRPHERGARTQRPLLAALQTQTERVREEGKYLLCGRSRGVGAAARGSSGQRQRLHLGVGLPARARPARLQPRHPQSDQSKGCQRRAQAQNFLGQSAALLSAPEGASGKRQNSGTGGGGIRFAPQSVSRARARR